MHHNIVSSSSLGKLQSARQAFESKCWQPRLELRHGFLPDITPCASKLGQYDFPSLLCCPSCGLLRLSLGVADCAADVPLLHCPPQAGDLPDCPHQKLSLPLCACLHMMPTSPSGVMNCNCSAPAARTAATENGIPTSARGVSVARGGSDRPSAL